MLCCSAPGSQIEPLTALFLSGQYLEDVDCRPAWYVGAFALTTCCQDFQREHDYAELVESYASLQVCGVLLYLRRSSPCLQLFFPLLVLGICGIPRV